MNVSSAAPCFFSKKQRRSCLTIVGHEHMNRGHPLALYKVREGHKRKKKRTEESEQEDRLKENAKKKRIDKESVERVEKREEKKKKNIETERTGDQNK